MVKQASAYNAGDQGSMPGLGRSGEGNGNPLQYSCLENPMDGGACGYSPWSGKELGTTERLYFHFTLLSMGIKKIKHYVNQVYSQILKI